MRSVAFSFVLFGLVCLLPLSTAWAEPTDTPPPAVASPEKANPPKAPPKVLNQQDTRQQGAPTTPNQQVSSQGTQQGAIEVTPSTSIASAGNTNPEGNQTEPDPLKTPQQVVDQSLKDLFPLDKEDIYKYKKRADERNSAISPSTPNLRTRTQNVKLEAGSAPTTVYLTANNVTSLVFHDASGASWPITSITNGSSEMFNVLRPEVAEENLINIVALQAYASANIVVTFKGRDVPLVVKLVSDSVTRPNRNADAMVLYRINHYGPDAVHPITASIKETTSSDMMSFLDGVPPKDAKRMKIEPRLEATTVWELGNNYFVRTSHTLISPAWTAVTNGAGNVKVYEITKTPRLITSENGKTIKVTIKN